MLGSADRKKRLDQSDAGLLLGVQETDPHESLGVFGRSAQTRLERSLHLKKGFLSIPLSLQATGTAGRADHVLHGIETFQTSTVICRNRLAGNRRSIELHPSSTLMQRRSVVTLVGWTLFCARTQRRSLCNHSLSDGVNGVMTGCRFFLAAQDSSISARRPPGWCRILIHGPA